MDSRHQLIIVFKHAEILINDEVENFINWELLKHFRLYLFAIYTFGIYYEKNDSLLYYQTLLVIE
jgi:hypothetical protein